MDRMLVVVFDTEKKAYEGKKALLQLEDEGSIVVYAYAVVAKNAGWHRDGEAKWTILVRSERYSEPRWEALIGLLGVPRRGLSRLEPQLD